MLLNVMATIAIVYWLLTGIKLGLQTWMGPYAPIWALVTWALAVTLLLPLWAIWS